MLALGPTRLGDLVAMFTSAIILLLVVASLALVAWVGFIAWKSRSSASTRVIPYPEEATHVLPIADPFTPPPPPQQAQPTPPTSPTTQPSPHVPVGDLTEQFRALDWFQFEKIVALIYRKLGDVVERRGGANADGGLDLLLRRNGVTIGVQCKHWKTWKVGVKSVREFLGALTAAGLKEGIFVSLGDFTSDAATLASRHGIRLVVARNLTDLVDRAGVRSDPEFLHALADTRKYCPKCERELVIRTAAKGANTGQKFWGCSTYPRCNYILRT